MRFFQAGLQTIDRHASPALSEAWWSKVCQARKTALRHDPCGSSMLTQASSG